MDDTPRRDRATRLAAALAVAACAAAVFSVTVGHSLVWDDWTLVPNAGSVYSRGGLSALFLSPFPLGAGPGGAPLYYRPLVLLSLLAGEAIPLPPAMAHHLVNVILHTVNALLVLALLGRLLPSLSAATAGALLFAVHPVHTESVAFVSGRTDPLACCLALIAALLWYRARGAGGGASPLRHLPGAAAFFASLLAKETSAALPAILLLSSFAEPRDTPPAGGWWRRSWGWVLTWGAALALYGALRWYASASPWWHLSAVTGPGDGAVSPNPSPLALLVRYLGLLPLPWPLLTYYTADLATPSAPQIVAAGVLVAVTLSLSRSVGRFTPVTASLWILLFLLPVLGVVRIPGTVMAERFLYLPSVGFAMIAGMLYQRAHSLPRARVPAVAAFATLGAILGAATVSQSLVWKNETTLFGEMARTTPRYALGHLNLGYALENEGRYTEAIEAIEDAIRVRPDLPMAWNNLGAVLMKTGRTPEALGAFRRAATLNPALAVAQVNLGMALVALGDLEGARAVHNRLATLDPALADLLLGIIRGSPPPGRRGG